MRSSDTSRLIRATVLPSVPELPRAAALGVRARPMTDDDLIFVAALYASTRAEEVAVTGWPIEHQRAFLAHQHDAQHRHYRSHYPDAHWLILEKSGAPVGRLYLDRWERELRVIDISLVPSCRSQGIGAAVLRDVQDLARALGIGVSIHVEKNNPARHLYDRLGFVLAEDKGVYDLLEWGMPPRG
jgi:ribosomal protein S18 acetylase RimI-like enzyme